MATRKVSRLGLTRNQVERLESGGIMTARDIFETSLLQIMCSTSTSYRELNGIVANAADSLMGSRDRTALDIFTERVQSRSTKGYLSTGIREVDNILKGGLPIGSICDIVGPPGIGKTQFCFNCCIATLIGQTQDPVPSSSSILYFDTELKFDVHRLLEMAAHRYDSLLPGNSINRTGICNQSASSVPAEEEFLSRIHVRRPETIQELTAELDNLQAFVISNRVRLIVVDSIAALARKDGLSVKEGTKYVMKQAGALAKLAAVCDCAILATNQVMVASSSAHASAVVGAAGADFAGTSSHNEGGVAYSEQSDCFWDEESRSWFRPCLGLGWAHCVSTRLLLTTLAATQTPHPDPSTDPSSGISQGPEQTHNPNPACTSTVHVQRTMLLQKSAVSAACSLSYFIAPQGIVVSG